MTTDHLQQGAEAEAVGVSKEDEIPLRHSEYEFTPIRRLICRLKGPSEINTDSGLLLLGCCSGNAGAFSRQYHIAWQVIHSFMVFFLMLA